MQLWFHGREDRPMVVVEAVGPAANWWDHAARDAARQMFKQHPDDYSPLDRLLFKFPAEDFTPELLEAARAAFRDEWNKLAPDRQLGGGSEQVRR